MATTLVETETKPKTVTENPTMPTIAKHCIVALMSFTALNVFAFVYLEDSPYLAFAVLMAGYLAFGMVHFNLLYKIHPWADREHFLREALFTVFLTMLAIVFLSVCSKCVQHGTCDIPFTLATIYFMLPFLVKKTLHEADKIFVRPQQQLER